MGLVRQINVGSDVGYLWPYTPKAVSATYDGDTICYKLVGPIDGIYYVYNVFWGDTMNWFSASKLTQAIEVKFENDMCRPYTATIMPKIFWETLKNNSVNWIDIAKPSEDPSFWTSTFHSSGYYNNKYYVIWTSSSSWGTCYTTETKRARLGFYV